MTGPTGAPTSATNPALSALGDRLESAASTAVASGGLPPAGGRMRKLAIIPALALFVVAGMVIASLLPGGGGATAEATVISAARETSDRATGRFEMTVEATGLAGATGGGSDGMALTTTGAYDADRGLFQASLDTSALLAALPGSEALGEVGPTIDAVIAGNDVYLDVSPLASVLGAEWVKVPLPDLAGEEGVASAIDPSTVLDALEGAGADMDEVGQEDVRGVATTHYAGSIDLQEAYDSIPADDRASLESTFGEMIDSFDLPDMPAEVWVDDEGLVRRVVVSVDAAEFGVPGLEQAGGVKVTAEFFDIGEDVTIEVPPADQVLALDELMPEGLLDGLGELDEFGDLEGLLDDLDAGALGDELERMLDELDLGALEDDLQGMFDGFDLEGMDLEGMDLEGLMDELEAMLGDLEGGGEPGSPGVPGGPGQPAEPPSANVPEEPSDEGTA
jgi:hypothetical protein